MRYILAVIILYSAISSNAQPGISKKEMVEIYNTKTDTLGYRVLTGGTYIREYKGKAQRPVRNRLRSIRSTMSNNIIYNTIAGAEIKKLIDYKGSDAEHILFKPKYKVTDAGIIIIAERDIRRAPWNDLISNWHTIDYYFVGFDKKVSLVQTTRFNPRLIEFIGKIEFYTQSIEYSYPDSMRWDSVKNPEFAGGINNLRKYLETNIRYPEVALENNIQGLVTISFWVNTDKSITNITDEKSADPFLYNELKRIIVRTKDMWDTAMADGNEIPAKVKLSVGFTVTNKIGTKID